MKKVRMALLETPPERAVAALKAALGKQGFSSTCEVDLSASAGKIAGDGVPWYRVVHAYDPDMARGVLEQDGDAGPALPLIWVIRGYGEGSLVEVFAPPLLCIAAQDEPKLASCCKRAREVQASVLDAVRKDVGESEHGAGDEDGSIEAVEKRLLRTIRAALDALDASDEPQPAKLLELAKAYAAVASLRRTEEVELHLS